MLFLGMWPFARTIREYLLRQPILSSGAAFLAHSPPRTDDPLHMKSNGCPYACVALACEKPRQAEASLRVRDAS